MINEDEIMLPTRDFLRQLMAHRMVKESSIKNILRKRGVFTKINEKEITAPLLIKTGISPIEYINLQETYKSKEETPKSKTWQVKLCTSDDLLDLVPQLESSFLDSAFNNKFGSVQLVSKTDFSPVNSDPSHIYMEFTIERFDPLKNIGSGKMPFNGRIELQKSNDILTINLIHSSSETREFSEKTATHIIKHFKSNGFIQNNEDIYKIKFSNFNNEKRVDFLRNLTKAASSDFINFADTADIQFSSDSSVNDHPEKIVWMKDKIDNLKIKGKDLHNTFFVTDDTLHKYLKIYSLLCNYNFNLNGSTGDCRILFYFNDEDDGELTINITSFRIETNNSEMTKNQIKNLIIDEFNKIKNHLYSNYKNN